MSQHDMTIDNASGSAVRADVNSALAAVMTKQSGATAPSPTFANMWWYDTSVGQLKIRDNANAVWTPVFLPVIGTGEIVINENGDDVNFRIESDTNANIFFVDAGLNSIGLGGVPTNTSALDILLDTFLTTNRIAGYILSATSTVNLAFQTLVSAANADVASQRLWLVLAGAGTSNAHASAYIVHRRDASNMAAVSIGGSGTLVVDASDANGIRIQNNTGSTTNIYGVAIRLF